MTPSEQIDQLLIENQNLHDQIKSLKIAENAHWEAANGAGVAVNLANDEIETKTARITELEEQLKATQDKNKEGINGFINLMDHATKAPTAEQGILLLAGTVQKLRAAQPPQEPQP